MAHCSTPLDSDSDDSLPKLIIANSHSPSLHPDPTEVTISRPPSPLSSGPDTFIVDDNGMLVQPAMLVPVPLATVYQRFPSPEIPPPYGPINMPNDFGDDNNRAFNVRLWVRSNLRF
ncbi:hypothetical protein BV898_08954 [Hypsibius exemplaris]|uniref:Uncharacterized protein n=1 Tax=Hypsibius exemplaris TaxID=2072580 RepID=A0A1W0WP47_HYPEX|nr:hypothetical protein BV898_08954 [Hypsibius exemplaris]